MIRHVREILTGNYARLQMGALAVSIFSACGQSAAVAQSSINPDHSNDPHVPVVLMYHDIIPDRAALEATALAERHALEQAKSKGGNPAPTVEPRGDVLQSHFESQLQWLVNQGGFNVISVDDLYAFLLTGRNKKGEILPPNPVVLTFDDGYQSGTYVQQRLGGRFGVHTGLPATFFVHTSFLGVVPTAAQLASNPFSKRHLSVTELQGIVLDPVRNGQSESIPSFSHLFRVGSHTLTHPQLSSLIGKPSVRHNRSALEDELKDSRSFLESNLGNVMARDPAFAGQFRYPADFFAYPYGNITPPNQSFNPAVLEATKEACYKMAFIIGYPSNMPEWAKQSILAIPRVEMSMDVDVGSDNPVIKQDGTKSLPELIKQYKRDYGHYLLQKHAAIPRPPQCEE